LIPFVRNSYLFVDFFFVLSGFVVTHAYGEKIKSVRALGIFVVRRFGRVWPLHAAMLVAFLSVEALRSLALLLAYPAAAAPFSLPPAQPAALLRNLLLVQAFGFDKSGTFNLPSWSISTEFYTYILFAIFCLIRPKWQTIVAVAISGMGIAVVSIYSNHHISTEFDYGFFRCIYGFFVGHLTYRIRERHAATISAFGATALEGATIAFLILFVSTIGDNALSLGMPLIFGATVYIFSFESGAASALLQTRPFQALGAWSYSIYMTHMLWLFLLGRAVAATAKLFRWNLSADAMVNGQTMTLMFFGNMWATDLVAILYLAVTVAFSSITFRVVEGPARLFFNRLSIRLARPAVAQIEASATVKPN
jgi:peptidoglycan/LPS O-acetylase OafA/YrhL